MQGEHYCEHFRNLKFTKSIEIPQQPSCKLCLIGKNYLWVCLAKNCVNLFCDRNNKQHMKLHLQCSESKHKKQFHSIFINILTAQIYCMQCGIQIYDLDQIKFSTNHGQLLVDPFVFRVKIHPALGQFDNEKNKITGQLQNSQGHRKISKALTGFFCNKTNYAINSALQFLMQFELFRDIVLNIKPFTKEIEALTYIFTQAEQAEFRAIPTEELIKIITHDNPSILGYERKDPFQHVIGLMTKVHQLVKYYTTISDNNQYDEWDLLGNPSSSSKLLLNCPLFDNTSIVLSLNYECKKCVRVQSLPANINFMKLFIPKKKRKAKQIEKQLAEHRISSPIKNRGNSLTRFFKLQQQCPLTIAELIIQFLKQPMHKDKTCMMCKEPLNKNKMHFQSLPQYLIIQINRMGSDKNSIDFTNVQLNTQPLDLSTFTGTSKQSMVYQLETALCVQNAFSFPVIARSRFNKQMYIFKNQVVTMLKTQKSLPNPYVICYKRVKSTSQLAKIRDTYHNIKSSTQINQQSQNQSGLLLPDFWLCQLKNSIARPLRNQLSCKHGKLKPNIYTKMKKEQRVPIQVYEYLVEMYKGKLYHNQSCKQCTQQIQVLMTRKKMQKNKLIEYQKIKSNCQCMISSLWIKRWMKFLYSKQAYGYLSKGHPMPGPIDNKTLLDGQKCRVDLQKNQDYKVVNIYIWKFLKQLYTGGPQIRYKWNKGEASEIEQQKIRQIKQTAKEIKQVYAFQSLDSPKKHSQLLQRTSSFAQSIKGSQELEQLSIPQEPN